MSSPAADGAHGLTPGRAARGEPRPPKAAPGKYCVLTGEQDAILKAESRVRGHWGAGR